MAAAQRSKKSRNGYVEMRSLKAGKEEKIKSDRG